MKRIVLFSAIIILIVAIWQQLPNISKPSFFASLSQKIEDNNGTQFQNEKVVYQESVVTDVVQESLPSVVTIGISTTKRANNSLEIDPFNSFTPYRQAPQEDQKVDQNIGSGFIISEDGLIITNKHVVIDADATYQVLTNNQKEYQVLKIYRDPLNDLAILKIDASGLKPLKLGNSSKLKLGQLAIAIGTPLGEFQNTITVGVVSGLGRGITAGSPFEGFVEKLDNVIQTDAAISPGNSGGPLLNSSGQAIGVNTALASEGQNIGFAIPINVVKELVESFHANGGVFERPYIGVRYQMVDRATAIRMDVAEGAYVESVVEGSPAAKAGIEADDIITAIDGKKLNGDEEESLAKTILKKKIGESMHLRVWRDSDFYETDLVLEGSSE